MSYSAIPNQIAHEIQVTEGIHLSGTSRKHIERLVYEAIRKETAVLRLQAEQWRKEAIGI
jgi:hypothetical protein